MPESWGDVIDRPDERLEFGACHEHLGWRRHASPSFKFRGLKNALHGSEHSIQRLLQTKGGNVNARNHRDRGPALFAAVWFGDARWALLADPQRIAVVASTPLAAIPKTTVRSDEILGQLRRMLDEATTVERFDSGVYARLIRPNSADA